MDTYIIKSKYEGWKAVTEIDLDSNQVLTISTRKRPRCGTLYTSASVAARDGAFLSHRVFEDYNKRVLIHSEVKRVTEKAVSDCHHKALALLPNIKDAVANHYANI